jgi:hypothetical protein
MRQEKMRNIERKYINQTLYNNSKIMLPQPLDSKREKSRLVIKRGKLRCLMARLTENSH